MGSATAKCGASCGTDIGQLVIDHWLEVCRSRGKRSIGIFWAGAAPLAECSGFEACLEEGAG